MKNNIAKTEIYFKKVSEPKIGKIYYQFNNGIGFPVIVLEGQFFASNGRLSNYWYWRNLRTGKKESGYGNFYKLKKHKGGKAGKSK